MADRLTCDLAIVGGGLAGGLIALAMRARRPEVDLLLVEAGETIGGNHLWSFFGSDVGRRDRWLLERLVAHAWNGHEIRFPARQRVLKTPYYSIPSERLDAEVRAAMPAGRIITGAQVNAVDPAMVLLADGRRIVAGGVIDCRGPADLERLDLGWQKFVGQELRFRNPHGLERPIVMDATVDQIDGYRFVYCLPFDARTVFVEDTYYSDTPELDVPAIEKRIEGYARRQGWGVGTIGRSETGVLPVVLGGDFERYWASGGDAAKAGVRAGLFHPTTGYSLPDAVRTALLVAGQADLGGAALARVLHDHARRRWHARGFYRLLDRMLFRAGPPQDRYRVLERFYGMNPGLIGRFYAARSTFADKARLLIGRPPVPLLGAMAQLSERRPA